MKLIGTTLIFIGIIFGVFGARSYWHSYLYNQASTTVKATVKSAEIKPMSGKAVGSIRIVLSYKRDGLTDSLEYNFSEAYSNKEPLPSEEELKSATYYVRYVPKEKTNKNIPDWVMVSKKGEFEEFYGISTFTQMFTFILLGIMVRMFARKNQATL